MQLTLKFTAVAQTEYCRLMVLKLEFRSLIYTFIEQFFCTYLSCSFRKFSTKIFLDPPFEDPKNVQSF